MLRKSTIVWDDQRDSTVHIGMNNHTESDASYLRKAVEFYEMNKAGAAGLQQVLERLARLEQLLKNGVIVGDVPQGASDDGNDELFDELLEQME